MRAIVYHGTRDVRVEHVPDGPRPHHFDCAHAIYPLRPLPRLTLCGAKRASTGFSEMGHPYKRTVWPL